VSRDSLLKETEHCRVCWDAKGEKGELRLHSWFACV
jgi:hypothetical protein